METKKVTLTIPIDLYNKSKELTKTGIFPNLSELFRFAIREEIEEISPLIKNGTRKEIWTQGLKEIREMIKKAGGYNKTKEEVIVRLKEIREDIWQKEYADSYR